MADFNPFSFDSQLATIIETLRQQNLTLENNHEDNQKAQASILAEQKITNGRVRALEGRWKYITGIAAGISLCATALWEIAKKFF